MFASIEHPRAWWRHAPTLTVCLGIGVAALTPSPELDAQQSGALQGWVYDERGQRPLEGVTVLVATSGERASTDREGRFYVEAVPAGRIDVRLALDGYVSQVESVEITPLEVTLIQFRLQPVAAVLDEVLVRLGIRRTQGHTEGEAAGRAEGSLSAADLLIQRIPGLSARRTSGSVGEGLRVSLRGANSISLSDQPAVYLDGVRVDVGGTVDLHVLDQIPAADVLRIRVLRGPAAATLYPLSAAGVILVETRRAPPP
jgi:hypothetical protein